MEAVLLSCMARVFPDGIPDRYARINTVTGFSNECVCWQLAYRAGRREDFRVRLDGPGSVLMYHVRLVAVQLPAYAGSDADYLRREPGLYPDLLEPCAPGEALEAGEGWRSLFLEIEPGALPAGRHTLTITLNALSGGTLWEGALAVRVMGAALPGHGLIYTRWFHCDALSAYYNVPVFSREHWGIMENFLRKAVRQGMNMALTPIHTPPLDTDIGAERQTVQLVRVTRTDPGRYHFDFSLLDRWVRMCQGAGIRYFEMAHLYTQWGAAAAPKIIAATTEGAQRIFGWDTPACGGGYGEFLAQYLPALTGRLDALGISDRCFFHISDEPGRENRDAYLAAKRQAAPFLRGFPVLDALLDVSLWDEGLVDRPVAATDAIGPFLDRKIKGLWAYYCCGQYKDVSNGFVAMPGERTRVLGAQLYKYGIEGFLQWGYNYYFGRNSRYAVNPYRTCDGDGCWPAGDPFIVYPSADGHALDSLRGLMTQKALDDVRALRLLESLAGRERAMALLGRTLGGDMSFSSWQRGEAAMLRFRTELEDEITSLAGAEPVS